MSIPSPKLLILDDESALMRALCDTLGAEGYDTTGFTSAAKALSVLREQSFDLLITDLMMPEMDGISLLNAAFEIDPNLAGIVMTGHASVDTAVKALKAGAVDYILKPFKLGAVLPVLARALTLRRLRMENIQLREAVSLYELSMAIAFAGDSKSILDKIADAAAVQSNARHLSVLLLEEQGDVGAAPRPELLVAAVRGDAAGPLQAARIPAGPDLRAWAERWGGETLGVPEPAPLGAVLPPGLSVPMLAGGKLTGILHFDLPSQLGLLTLGQTRAMHILASTGASALEAISGMEKLRAAEERYRRLAEDAPDIVSRYEVHPLPAVTYVNPAILTATGYAPEEFYADRHLFLNIVHPEDRQTVESVTRGEHPCGGTVTVRWTTKAGTEIWVEQRNRHVRDRLGRLIAIETVSRDITQRKTLEERLRHAERLESIGKLTAGVAHDFNNLLTIVNGYAALALQSAEPQSSQWSRINEVKKAGDQAAALTAQLLAFSRKQVLQPRSVDLEDLLNGMDAIIRGTTGPEVEVSTSIQPGLGFVKIDPAQMHQVILNLTVNARDAMPDGGRLVFKLCNMEADEQNAGALEIVPGAYVMLAVSDTGCGMPPEVKQRAFEPFFTTKSLGRGTGLGLASVHGIVEQSGGHIRIDSESGVGTTLTIFLPRCGAGADPVSVPIPAITRGNETILLVEDDPGVRALAHEVLFGAGYYVLLAQTSEEAVHLAETHPGEIALLLTDMCLSAPNGIEMNGAAVANRVCAIRPAIKCLFVSGFTESLPVANSGQPTEFEFLPKPYSPAQLCERVRRILDTPGKVGCILVVDDEQAIRNLLQEILEGAGYDVLTAANGREAAKILRKGTPVDLVITDLVMPEMEGIEFIACVRNERPEVKIVATTGGHYADILRAASHLGAHATVSKPLTPDLVLNCIRKLTT